MYLTLFVENRLGKTSLSPREASLGVWWDPCARGDSLVSKVERWLD